VVSEEWANVEALKLKQAGRDKRWFELIDKNTFLIVIMPCGALQLRAIAQAYERATGHALKDDVEKFFSFSAKDVMLRFSED